MEELLARLHEQAGVLRTLGEMEKEGGGGVAGGTTRRRCSGMAPIPT